MNRRHIIISAISALILSVSGAAWAQTQQQQQDQAAAGSNRARPERQERTEAPPPVTAATRTSTDKYVPPSPKNLSKLYWRAEMFQVTDNQAIDNFLMINECDIYQGFFTNDFEWEQIRQSYRDYLTQNKAKFTDYFEFMIPISLTRYDTVKGTFGFEEDSKVFGLRKFEIVENSIYDGVCGKSGAIPKYPVNVMLTLNRPLSLQEIPVRADVAQAYLDRTGKVYEKMAADVRLNRYERQAFLRLKVKMRQYSGEERSRSGEVLASFFADLEGVEVYEDQTKEHLLFSSGGTP